MSSLQTLLLDDIRASLTKKVRGGLHSSTLEDAFAAWLVNETIGLDQSALTVRLLSSTGRKPSDTAALGFQAVTNSLDDPTKAELLTDLQSLLDLSLIHI